jgi:outer membrane protein assembly factor BamB
MTPRLTVFAAAVLFAAAARAADWPEFRGPTGQGLVTEGRLPVEWGPKTNVAWKQALPGQGWSSPVVAGGKIYLTAAVPAENGKPGDLSLQALCLDADSGNILWAKEVFAEKADAPRIHPKNSHASPTPIVAGDRLYVHFGHMGTACLDLDGNVKWRNNELHYAPVHGNGGTPVLVDDALIFTCDGGDKQFVAALKASDGSLLWKTPRKTDPKKGFSFATPLAITVDGKKQVICPGSDAVMAYDPANGEEIWRVRYNGYSVIPRPVYAAGLVFVSTSFDSPKLLAIRPDGKGDVTDTHLAWTMPRNAPNTPSPLALGDDLYVLSDGGVLSCVEAKTGKEHWHERVGGAYSASPVSADGKVYLQSEDGVGVVVKAGPKFDLVGKNDLKEKTLASYAVIDGDLLIRTETSLYRIKQK